MFSCTASGQEDSQAVSPLFLGDIMHPFFDERTYKSILQHQKKGSGQVKVGQDHFQSKRFRRFIALVLDPILRGEKTL